MEKLCGIHFIYIQHYGSVKFCYRATKIPQNEQPKATEKVSLVRKWCCHDSSFYCVMLTDAGGLQMADRLVWKCPRQFYFTVCQKSRLQPRYSIPGDKEIKTVILYMHPQMNVIPFLWYCMRQKQFWSPLRKKRGKRSTSQWEECSIICNILPEAKQSWEMWLCCGVFNS